jgi:CHAT domain-containing protein/Tfp pilus assembly protein PilF
MPSNVLQRALALFCRAVKAQRALTMFGFFALFFLISSFAVQLSLAYATPPLQGTDCDALNAQGMVLLNQAQYAQAYSTFETALACYQEIGDRAGEGTTLNNIGFIYHSLGRYAQALDTCQQSLAVSQEIGDRAVEGAALNNIGFIYHSLGQHAQALDFYQQSLAVSQEIGDRAGEGTTLNNIGLIYHSLGRYERALDYYQQSLGTQQEIGNRAGEGTTLTNIGAVYDRLGQYERALDYYQQGLGIAQEMGGRAGEGAILNNIGFIYARLGQYAQALDTYRQSLTIRKEIGDRAGEGTTLDNIGGIYDRLGQYAQALEYYQQSLAISQEIGDRAGEGITLNNIGGIYDRLGQYAQALEYYQQSLTIAQEIGGRAEEGTTLNNIGFIYARLGQYPQALEYLQQSLAISQEIGDRAGESRSLNNIGGIYHRLGQYPQALDFYQQSLAISQEIGNRAGEGITLNSIGGIHDRLGQYTQALDTYRQAMEKLESVRAQAGSEQSRAKFIAQYADLYRRTVDLFHQQGQDSDAFFTTERGRARAFLDSLATGQVRLRDDDAADLLAQEGERYAQRQAIRFALAEARAANPPDPTAVSDLEAELAETEAAYQAVQEAMAARGAELAALVPGRRQDYVLSVPQVQELLDEGTTLISYFLLEDKTLAFIITSDSFETVSLEVTPAQLVTQIRDFRDFPGLDTVYPDSAITLYGWLIVPLKEHLNTPHLVIIPHSVLHYLPFAALTDGQRYLIDDYVLTTLPSASALPFIQDNVGRELTKPLVLGNPVTGDFDATASFATQREGLGVLPFAEQEAKAIAALYGVEPFIGRDATEGVVRERAAEAGILHLAAHGFYNPVAPLSSLIALAPDEASDGWLTVGEVYGLDLSQADLVVLSACQTNLGELSAGDELVGLTRAFIFAGTPTVVSSLWSVEDESTALLMERFYTHLRAGVGKAEALRQAQLEVREKYPSPYYWAGFVLSGDGGVSPTAQRFAKPLNRTRLRLRAPATQPVVLGFLGLLFAGSLYVALARGLEEAAVVEKQGKRHQTLIREPRFSAKVRRLAWVVGGVVLVLGAAFWFWQ